MDLDYALRYPVLTIGSGPANSIRGAAYLTGRRDAIVIDVGVTSADVGVLAGGFPRQSNSGVDIGGIRTNFRMPDLVTIAVGGGTRVVEEGEEVRVGPASVGYHLTADALVFGGNVPTLTDAAVSAGRLAIGDVGAVERARRRAGAWAARCRVDARRRRRPREDLPRAPPRDAVGGGSMLVPTRCRARRGPPPRALRRGQRDRRGHRVGFR